MTEYWKNGFGAATGSQLAIAKDYYLHLGGSARVVYLSSELGEDAAWPRGSDEARPVATLAQAITNAAFGGIICVAADHDETIDGAVTPLGYQTIIGFGRSNGKPTAKIRFDLDGETAGRIIIENDGIKISNIYFPEKPSETTAAWRIYVEANHFSIEDCYVESGDNDTLSSFLRYGEDADEGSRIVRCSFVSTATAADTTPAQAITDTGTLSDFAIEDCTFDGGAYGWGYLSPADMPCAFYRSHGAPGCRTTGLSLLRGADFVTLGNPGYTQVSTATGGSKVVSS